MDLTKEPINPRYLRTLNSCEPYLISYPANWPFLDLAPFGIEIPKERRYTATSLESQDVITGLHHLDRVTFGGQDMLMPRWVLFDCGEFPGVVFGLGRRASELPDYARIAYRCADRPDTFVPLSMWVAIRCAEEGAWFGHNLSSANLILKGDDGLAGLALMTKTLAVKLTRGTKQYGATQWSSGSIGLHLRLGPMEVLSAYTPAHTHAETFAYLIEVDDAQLTGSLMSGWQPEHIDGERVLAADDHAGIRALHHELEAGARWQLVRAERREEQSTLMHLNRMD